MINALKHVCTEHEVGEGLYSVNEVGDCTECELGVGTE